MRALVTMCIWAMAVAGCSKRASYHFSTHNFDDYQMGHISLDTTPPGSRVYTRAIYKGSAEARTPRGDVSSAIPVDQTMKDWTLIGTTPIAEFPVLISGRGSDRHIDSSAEFSIRLEDLSLRIEKEGYQTVELNHVGFAGDKCKLVLDLVPVTSATQPAATQPSAQVTFRAPDAFAVELADGSEVRIRADREKLAQLGLAVAQVGDALKSSAGKNAGELVNAMIDAGNGQKVRLVDVVTVEPGGG